MTSRAFISPLAVRYAFMATHIGLLSAIFAISIKSAIGDEWPDIWTVIFTGVPGISTLHYLIPVAILCMCGRESAYERSWVEVFYITYQTAFSIVTIAFSFISPDPSIIIQALAAVHTFLLVVWFGWTLWLANRGAKLMGPPWTRDLVLRKVSMGKLVKLPEWREIPDIALDKLDSKA